MREKRANLINRWRRGWGRMILSIFWGVLWLTVVAWRGRSGSFLVVCFSVRVRNCLNNFDRSFVVHLHSFVYIVFYYTAAVASIVGASELYVRTGSTISLTCIIQGSGAIPPRILFWFHDSKPSQFLFSFLIFFFFLFIYYLVTFLNLSFVYLMSRFAGSSHVRLRSFSRTRFSARRHFARNGTDGHWNVVEIALDARYRPRRR